MSNIEEYDKVYKQSVEYLKEVSKGGKHYASCSWMDIATRADRLNSAKEKLILALGHREFDKMYGDK